MMDAPKLNPQDTLKESFPKLNQSIDNANEALNRVVNAENDSAQAKEIAEQTQTELRQAVLEGDSSPLAGMLSVGADGTVYEDGPQQRLVAEHNQVKSEIKNIKDNNNIIIQDYSAVGDGIADDTNAAQSIHKQNKNVQYKGKIFKVTNLTLGDPDTIIPPTNQQGSGNSVIIGDGGGLSNGTTFIAKEEVDTLVKRNNLSGVRFEGLTLKCESLARVGLDLSWIGTAVTGSAPASLNKLEKIWVEKALDLGINLDQFHDSVIDGITVRMSGKNPDPIALSLQGPGGYWGISNFQLYGGRTRLSCQNANISKGVITKGVELTGSSYNHIAFTAVHFIDLFTYAIWSNTSGNGTRALSFDSCYFASSLDSGYIQGRFWSGATFRNCHFKSSKLTENIIAAAGSGVPPVFRFENCSFESPIEDPINCIFEFVDCRKSDGSRFSYRTNGYKFDDNVSTVLPRLQKDGIYWETSGVTSSNQAKTKEYAFLNSPQDNWITINLDSSYNGIWLIQVSGGKGSPQAIFAICRNSSAASGSVISTVVSCFGSNGTEKLEIRWQDATKNYNPEIRITGGSTERNIVVQAIGIGGNS